MHIPCLAQKVVDILSPREGEVVFDLTAGEGGHSLLFARKIGKSGKLVMIDIDDEPLSIAEKRIAEVEEGPEVWVVRANYKDFDEVAREIGIEKIDIIFADLGACSLHFDSAERGFSFKLDGPLDMRYDRRQKLTAKDVVNTYPLHKLEKIIREFGEEKLARQIAKWIHKMRQKKAIETTGELARICEIVYARAGVRTKIHPATRTFQAIRIEVNRELDNLKELLSKIPEYMGKGGRVGIISFHSLEDRTVKVAFAEWQKQGLGHVITKKPVTPDEDELILNPRCRSAKFRAFRFN